MRTRQPRQSEPPRTALYLRCYPRDPHLMEFHRAALRLLAETCGLPEPFEFQDDGRRAADGLPQLESLLRHAEQGVINTLLVPGRFVFALDDAAAALVARRLRRSGCRIVEIPSDLHRRVRHAPLPRA